MSLRDASVLAVAVLWLIVILSWLWGWVRRRRRSTLDGWWHLQAKGDQQHWTPKAWRDACEASYEKSRKRRQGR